MPPVPAANRPLLVSARPVRTVRINPSHLTAGGDCFNASILDFDGRRIMAYRWDPFDRSGSRIHLCELGRDYRPGPSTRLQIRHPMAEWSQEDPRLFVHRGQLHVLFVGCPGITPSRSTVPSILCARLSDDFKVEQVCYPHFDQRALREKNWGPFSHSDDDLLAVYTIGPQHVIYRMDGDTAFPVHGTANSQSWTGGLLRGGSAPVRRGDEYYSFFHGIAAADGVNVYSIGVYTFEAEPPFAMKRLAPHPIQWGSINQRPEGHPNATIFPCGAVFDAENGRWVVSAGVYDRHIDLFEFDDGDIERALDGHVCPPQSVLDPEDVHPKLFAAIAAATAPQDRREKPGLPGWCSTEKAAMMAALIQREKPSVVVEIGVFGGRSLIPQALALRENKQGVVYGIDPYTAAAATEGEFTSDPGGKGYWSDVAMLNRVRSACLERIGSLDLWPFVRLLEARSEVVAPMFDAHPIDILHIDGNHTEEVSTRDVRLYLPRVRPGGWVWVDDTDLGSVTAAVGLVEQTCDLVEQWSRVDGIAAYKLFRKFRKQ